MKKIVPIGLVPLSKVNTFVFKCVCFSYNIFFVRFILIHHPTTVPAQLYLSNGKAVHPFVFNISEYLPIADTSE